MDKIKIENDQDVRELNKLVIDFLAKNPPTLGHGYSHFIKTARNAYQLAIENNYQHPKIAYVCGLLHNLYRPARGESGKEDHETETARIAKELITETKFNKNTELIINTLNNHDQKILEKKANMLIKILSLADKIDMSFQRSVAYTWASNRYLEKNNQEKAYTSFLETIRDFSYYQVKAWNIFVALKNFLGVKKAINSYLETDQDLINAVSSETLDRISYKDEAERLSKLEAKEELEYLKEFNVEENNVTSICQNFKSILAGMEKVE